MIERNLYIWGGGGVCVKKKMENMFIFFVLVIFCDLNLKKKYWI